MGKSGLALRLTNQPFAPTASTHGRHIRPLETTEEQLNDGRREQREIWLWDLAGQRDYRLIHQFHLHEATVAAIVFDPARNNDPLAGIRYWHRALRLAQAAQGSSALPLVTLLVAARMDRGGRGVSREQIEELGRELGCAGYLETSAKTGQGIEELGQMVRKVLDWEQLPGVTSTTMLQEMKTFVLKEVQSGRILCTLEELYQAFMLESVGIRPNTTIRQQFEAVVGRIEAQGMVRRLGFGDLVLLQPERLDAYASALLIAVRNEQDGLGVITEERVQRGDFAIPSEEKLGHPRQEQLLLIAMIEELVQHELMLREEGSLLFPSQSTREHPDLATLEQQQYVIFRFGGPVLSLYTTLVVRLAQSEVFQKQEMWQRVVTYTTQLGGSFGMVLTLRGDEQADLGLFFDDGAREELRFLFEDFVKRHLERQVSRMVQRWRRFVCSGCNSIFPDEQVRKRRERGFHTIHCNICETETSLLDGIERVETALVTLAEKQADKRREEQRAKSTIEGKRKTEDFDVFFCHHEVDKAAVKEVGTQLMARGILPWLDEWELRPGLPWQRVLEEQIGKIKAAAIFVGKEGIGPWQQEELEAFLQEFVERGCPVIPVVLSDAPQKPDLPRFLKNRTWVDFRIGESDPLGRLVWGITGKREIWEDNG